MLRTLLIVTLCALTGLATAQQSAIGGLPARLRVQSVGANTTAPATGDVALTGAVRITGTNPSIIITETDAPSDETRWEVVPQGTNLRIRAVNDASSAATNVVDIDRGTGVAINGIALNGSTLTLNGATVITTANDGAGSTLDADLLDGLSSGDFCVASGAGCPAGSKLAAATVTVSGGACTVGTNRVNINSSCTYNSTGSTTITFTSSYGVVPVCVPHATQAAGYSAQFATLSGSTITLNTYNASNTLADSSYRVLCTGSW